MQHIIARSEYKSILFMHVRNDDVLMAHSLKGFRFEKRKMKKQNREPAKDRKVAAPTTANTINACCISHAPTLPPNQVCKLR